MQKLLLFCSTNSGPAPLGGYGWPIQLRNCEKLHFIAKNVYCAGAGTAADLQQLAVQMSQNYPPQTRE